MIEPVSLDDIKRHLVLDQDDTGDDAYLASLITAARMACELRTNRAIVGATKSLVQARFPGRSAPTSIPALAIPPAGSHDLAIEGGSVASFEIRYYDAANTDQLLAAEAVHASLTTIPALVRPMAAWPDTADRPDAVRITFVLSPLDAGMLQMAKHAIRLIVGHWYANREAVSLDARGALTELPLAVSWLLQPLRVFASS